ncbi:GNAT family N-acetyltransferase [Paenibacillus pedocola]|uniref:GNAT family N-acetyltransferase n=1 Tax=Paenibacillus pedocola TaxID=3242193 RepID=UPI0028779014|nr:GNAT family N-acetyltransferase [Paenibacillus typhae]
MNTFKLETNRLIIREFTLEDLEEVHAYASDPLVAKYMIWGPNSEAETRDYLKLTIDMQKQSPRRGFEFAVVLKATNQLLGGCGLHLSDPKQGEIGYCFNPLFWKQGYTSEAAEALLKLGFREFGLHRIYATCRPDNIGSAKVMQKIGMTYEGHLREHMWHKGGWHDSYLYSILEHEYKR